MGKGAQRHEYGPIRRFIGALLPLPRGHAGRLSARREARAAGPMWRRREHRNAPRCCPPSCPIWMPDAPVEEGPAGTWRDLAQWGGGSARSRRPPSGGLDGKGRAGGFAHCPMRRRNSAKAAHSSGARYAAGSGYETTMMSLCNGQRSRASCCSLERPIAISSDVNSSRPRVVRHIASSGRSVCIHCPWARKSRVLRRRAALFATSAIRF
jgi:hypothetical protein